MAREAETTPLLEWIPKVNRKYSSPVHLTPFTSLLERAIAGEAIRAVVHAPPRHAKTETILHAIPYGLQKRPDMRFGYASYNSKIALSKSGVALDIARSVGIPLGRTQNKGEWSTPERGGLLADGVGGAFTGFGLDCGFIDDPVKNRVQAESAVDRQTKKEWLQSTFITRLEPNASCFIFMTRWHPDDLSGFAINELGWQYVCLPAIREDADGNQTALWPERYDVDALHARKEEVGLYSWESLFQGAPRPRGGTVFGEPWAYENLPNQFQVAIGIDLAYSEKTSSDYSVAVVMYGYQGMFWIAEVYRVQQRPTKFLNVLKTLNTRYPRARWRWYASGTEEGAGDFIRQAIPKLEVLPPVGDKYIRAIPYSNAWNANKVYVPEDAFPWVEGFLSEHADFTGVKDLHDDQVDAAVAAFDLLGGPSMEYEGMRGSSESPRRPGSESGRRV